MHGDGGTGARVEPLVEEASSLEHVFRRERTHLLRLAAVVTGDAEAAADLVGDAFADLVAARDVRDPGAWLRVAVTRRSTSWVRRRIVARRYLEGVASTGDPSASGDGGLAPPVLDQVVADRVAVRDALSRLDPAQRAAVYLRYYLDRPEAEIAEALGCRPGTVKSRLSRAMIRLREELS